MNLTNLTKLKATTVNALEKITGASVDDFDKAAKERLELKEKLALLEEAETAERERLEAEQTAKLRKQRRALLLDVAKRAESTAADYDAATAKATALVGELVRVLTERESLFTQEAAGLTSESAHELLTRDERYQLIESLQRSAVTLSPATFANTWRTAVTTHCGHNTPLHSRLRELATAPNHPQQTATLSGALPLLTKAAWAMADSEPSKPNEQPQETSQKPKPDHSYTVDLRDSKVPVADLAAAQ